MSEWPQNEHGNYACPCCGFHTFGSSPPGTYDVCGICGWEEDCTGYLELDKQNPDPMGQKISAWDTKWWGYANGDLTIEVARSNFERMGFSTDKITEFHEAKKQSRGGLITPKYDELPRYDWRTDSRPFNSDEIKDT